MSAEKKTLVQKVNETKKRLATEPLKKSGHNSFQKYDYFELGDFLPTIIAAEEDLHFLNLISFSETEATLTIIDGDSDKTMIFTSPIADAATKGASPIQAIGSLHTYMRRYLYVMAYEISEHDSVDGLDQKDAKQEPKADPRPPKQEPPKVDERAAIIKQIDKLVYPDRTPEGKGKADGYCYEIYQNELKAYMSLNKDIKKLSDLNLNQLKDMLQKMDVPECLR